MLARGMQRYYSVAAVEKHFLKHLIGRGLADSMPPELLLGRPNGGREEDGEHHRFYVVWAMGQRWRRRGAMSRAARCGREEERASSGVKHGNGYKLAGFCHPKLMSINIKYAH